MGAMRPDNVSLLFTIASFLPLLLTSPATAGVCVHRTSSNAITLPPPRSKIPLSSLNPFCNKTDYPSLCQAAVNKYLPPNAGNDPIAVLKANINGTLDKLDYMVDATKKIIAEGAVESAVARLLNESNLGLYDNMAYDYEHTLESMAKKDMGEVSSRIDSCLTSIQTVIDTFIDPMLAPKVRVSPLVADDEELRQMAVNCLALKSEVK